MNPHIVIKNRTKKEILDKKFPKISFNTRLLLKEMQKRRIYLETFGSEDVIKATYERHAEVLYGICSNLISYPVGVVIDDKYYSKMFLKKFGFNVVSGEAFDKQSIVEALGYAKKIGYPVVLKPTVGSHGDYVDIDIKDEKELKKRILHFLKIRAGNGFYLVERQFDANEFRLFITRNNFFAAVSRIPANVLGDGKNNLLSLIKKENYRRMNPRKNCLCEIVVDDVINGFLKENGLTLNYIPKKGERFFLRKNSNVSTGGNCYDVTDNVNPVYIKLAKKILEQFGNLPFLGIDLLCKDITKKNENYVICELNSAPGLSLHMLPEKGTPRNVASAITDIFFPETRL